MKTKILNFVEAMQVGEILSKYPTPENVEILDYISSLLEIISPTEYLFILQKFTNEDVTQISQYLGSELLKVFTEGLIINNIFNLQKTYIKILEKL